MSPGKLGTGTGRGRGNSDSSGEARIGIIFDLTPRTAPEEQFDLR